MSKLAPPTNDPDGYTIVSVGDESSSVRNIPILHVKSHGSHIFRVNDHAFFNNGGHQEKEKDDVRGQMEQKSHVAV